MIYLDNAATTKPCTEACEAVSYTMRERFGNASSLHKMGILSGQVLSQKDASDRPRKQPCRFGKAAPRRGYLLHLGRDREQ